MPESPVSGGPFEGHPTGPAALAAGALLSPFTRLRRLLEGIPAGHARPIELTIGEPREQMPGFVMDKLGEQQALFAKYPPIRGTEELTQSILAWLERRYSLEGRLAGRITLMPVNGSREGLFYAVFPAMGRRTGLPGRAALLMPNPYYAAYIGAAYAADCEPVYLDATAETGHLPDLEALAANEALLKRTVGMYLCSPANPQGTVATVDYLRRALALARAYDFMLFADECYSEIYGQTPPPGALEAAMSTPDGLSNLVVFNSLSKRSNLPGLRSGFCAGDPVFMESLAEIRNLIAPQMSGPVQHLSAAVWSEEQHVSEIRRQYRLKFDVCDAVLGGRYGYQRPAGGFFLWLDVSQFGGGVETTVTLWKDCGVKVIPGAFLAQPGVGGVNPGDRYVRLALVQDPATIREALERVVTVLA